MCVCTYVCICIYKYVCIWSNPGLDLEFLRDYLEAAQQYASWCTSLWCTSLHLYIKIHITSLHRVHLYDVHLYIKCTSLYAAEMHISICIRTRMCVSLYTCVCMCIYMFYVFMSIYTYLCMVESWIGSSSRRSPTSSRLSWGRSAIWIWCTSHQDVHLEMYIFERS